MQLRIRGDPPRRARLLAPLLGWTSFLFCPPIVHFRSRPSAPPPQNLRRAHRRVRFFCASSAHGDPRKGSGLPQKGRVLPKREIYEAFAEFAFPRSGELFVSYDPEQRCAKPAVLFQPLLQDMQQLQQWQQTLRSFQVKNRRGDPEKCPELYLGSKAIRKIVGFRKRCFDHELGLPLYSGASHSIPLARWFQPFPFQTERNRSL